MCILLVCIIIAQGPGVAVMDKTQSLALRPALNKGEEEPARQGQWKVITLPQR